LLLFNTVGNIDYIWRILFAIGAIPAILVVYGRRKLPETPKYSLRVRGDARSAKKDWEAVSGRSDVKLSSEDMEVARMKWYNILTDRRFIISLIGTAGAWFMMDWAFYGNSIMSHQMLSVIVPSAVGGLAAIKLTTIYTAMIFGIAAFPAYWIATFTVDKIGIKRIQVLGFSAIAVAYLVLGVFHFLMSSSYALDFLIIYGLSYFFIEFGPNVTTFIYGPEMYPTPIRGLGSGISSAGGKMGAFVGTFLNVIVDAVFGESTLFLILAAISIVGSILTAVSLPETKGKSLEDISGEKRYLVHASPGGRK
ncbi:MAG: MFS transporter, partial [Thermoplasmata archaeon]